MKFLVRKGSLPDLSLIMGVIVVLISLAALPEEAVGAANDHLALSADMHAHVAMMATASESFANPAFSKLWNRTDNQVANGSVSRTFLWGPQPNTAGLQEDYSEAPGGQRLVQYFDKSRMEITNLAGDQSSPYYVTNGLIANELMSGRMQTGDNRFEIREPAGIGVAGDSDDTSGPTYMTLGRLTVPANNDTNILVAASVDRDGNVRTDVGDYGKKYQASYQYYAPETKHNIAGPFWTFLNQNGLTQNAAGQPVQGRLFEPVFYATGLPTTEAYWAQVKVAGQVKDVLVQAFERRVLTFTPSNTPAFQVEMGNVGQHYYKWRYGNQTQPPPPSAGGTLNITIENFRLNPGTVTIPVGTKVIWTNVDAMTHTTTSDSKLFSSGFLTKGKTFEFTFTEAGTFDYHCILHPTIRGRVIVVP